jgi:CheY-like chemotaxis protein
MNFDEKSHDTLIPEKYTILIVDDNPQNLKVLDAYLRAQGFKTLIASKI